MFCVEVAALCIFSPSLGLLRSTDGCIVGDPISLATCNATIGCHELQRMYLGEVENGTKNRSLFAANFEIDFGYI